MKTRYPKELLFSLGSLLLAIVVIQSIWSFWVRPNAQAVLTAQYEQMRKDPNYVPERSMFVIMKDWEQESCVILMIWALAMIGFIGTVRGIGDALAEAHKAVTGDISGVTEGLGVAFNSTLVALLLSLLLMFLLHHLQLAQERLVLDTETYLDNRLLRNLQVR